METTFSDLIGRYRQRQAVYTKQTGTGGLHQADWISGTIEY